MEEEKEFINQDIQRAATKTAERDPKTASIKAVKKSLDEFKGHALNTENEANGVSSLPSFVHLNPDLLAATIIFRHRTNYELLENIPKKERNNQLRKILNFRFPVVRNDETKYALLKGDLIRYIRIIEINLHELA